MLVCVSYYTPLDLHKEVVHDERVLVEHQTTNVSDHLSEETQTQCGHVLPRLVADAQEGLSNEQDQEEEHVDDVTRNVGTVLHRLPGLGALADFAVLPRHANLHGVFGVDIDVVGVDAVRIEGPHDEVEGELGHVFVKSVVLVKRMCSSKGEVRSEPVCSAVGAGGVMMSTSLAFLW
jgi:hypothetical protein